MKEGKVLLIVAPNSSGKSSLASGFENSEYNFQKINTKKLTQHSLDVHGRTFFKEELSKAAKILGQDVTNVKQMLQAFQTTRNKDLLKLKEIVTTKLPSNYDYFFDILYKCYFEEANKILVKGYNCVIDHNIFLDPYPYRSDKFLKLFSALGENFKILEIFSSIKKCFLNMSNRNRLFFEFVDNFRFGEEAYKATEKFDEILGHTAISYRQPLMLLEMWDIMYNFSQSVKKEDLVLERIKAIELKDLINQVIQDQKKLIGYIIYKKFPFVYVMDQLIESPQINYMLSFKDDSDVFITKKRFIHDYLIKMEEVKDPAHLADPVFFKTIIKDLLPWLGSTGITGFYNTSNIKNKPAAEHDNHLLKENLINTYKNSSYLSKEYLDAKKDILKSLKKELDNNIPVIVKLDKESFLLNKFNQQLLEDIIKLKTVIVNFSFSMDNWEGFIIKAQKNDKLIMLYINSSGFSLNTQNEGLIFIASLFVTLRESRPTFLVPQIIELENSENHICELLIKKITKPFVSV